MPDKLPAVLKPGATIGILGGGQLGRMLAQAAARLGLHCHIFSPESDSCAFEVVRRATVADYSDTAALDAFAAPASLSELVTVAYDDTPSVLWPLAERSLEAHLVKLVREGHARQEGRLWAKG